VVAFLGDEQPDRGQVVRVTRPGRLVDQAGPVTVLAELEPLQAANERGPEPNPAGPRRVAVGLALFGDGLEPLYPAAKPVMSPLQGIGDTLPTAAGGQAGMTGIRTRSPPPVHT
jgi:hypothetical protein